MNCFNNCFTKTFYCCALIPVHLPFFMLQLHKHTILYAEDDVDDLFLIQQAFEHHDGVTEIQHAHNGFEALQYLNEATIANKLPCLIVLDINMPGMDGRETLIRIRQSEDLKNIPTVLFSTSSSETDKLFARKWKAEFITKPLVYSEFENLAKHFLALCASKVSQKTY